MNHVRMVKTGLDLINGLDKSQTAVSSDKATLVHRFREIRQMAAYLVAEPQKTPDIQSDLRVDLREKINQAFDLSDLRELCFDLTIPYENLGGGENKQAKVVALIEYTERNDRLSDLSNYCRSKRSHLIWPIFPSYETSKMNVVQKPDLAVVINLASRFRETTPGDVAAYLDYLNQTTPIKANFFLVQNPNSKKEIELDGQWDSLIRTFHLSLNEARHLAGAERVHFFLSGPGPILFAIGCVWGTVEGAKLYHRHENTYHSVIAVSKNLHN